MLHVGDMYGTPISRERDWLDAVFEHDPLSSDLALFPGRDHPMSIFPWFSMNQKSHDSKAPAKRPGMVASHA